MLPIHPRTPRPPRALVRAKAVPRLFLPLLALLAASAACADATRPAAPAGPSAAVAGSATAAAAPSAAPKAYALVEQATASGWVTNGNTYNPAGSVWLERLGVGNYRLEFRNVGLQITGYPHFQVKPVRRSSTANGYYLCGHWGRRVGSALHVDVRCTRNGVYTDYIDTPFVVQVFDGSAAVAYATMSGPGNSGYAQHLSRAERVSRGTYHVFFKKDPLFSNGALPAAFVSWGRAPVACQIARLGSARELAGELGVEIVCRDRNGYAQDQELHVLAVPQAAKTGYALLAGSPLAPVPERSYNASGGSIVAGQASTGTTLVTFSALGTSWFDNGTVTVTPVGSNNASCAIDSWAKVTTSGTVSGSYRPWSVRIGVQCRTPDGLLVRTPFTVLALTRP